MRGAGTFAAQPVGGLAAGDGPMELAAEAKPDSEMPSSSRSAVRDRKAREPAPVIVTGRWWDKPRCRATAAWREGPGPRDGAVLRYRTASSGYFARGLLIEGTGRPGGRAPRPVV